ncbi:MAG: hypothetical protein ACQERB_13375 [Promethearchaeati archaeon]
MNKLGFISGLLSAIIFFLPFIPVGIYFGSESNPWLGFNYYIQFPVSIVRFGNMQIFLWGFLLDSSINLWVLENIVSFIFLTIPGLLTVIFSFVGCFKEDELGKCFIYFTFFTNLFMILYTLIGFTIYSMEILGIELAIGEIFAYLDYGFFILILNFIISIIAYITHPVMEVNL